MKRVGILAIVLGIILAMYPQTALANPGFGVSPPYVRNYYLLPGSHYEGTVYLVTSDVGEQWSVNVTIDAPDIEGWLTIDPAESFLWPLGVSQLPFQVIVDVPEDAELGTYTGNITVVRCPYPRPPGDVVNCIGALIEITLVVTDEEFFDFTVRHLWEVSTEEGWPIKFGLRIENTGNIVGAPAKARLDVYYPSNVLLQSVEDATLDSVEPFMTKDIIAQFPTTYLPIREYYFCRLAVYNETGIAWNSGLWTFSVSNNPPSTPSNPSPSDNATASPLNLGWMGGDPDAGDTVTYDVYFGNSDAPPLVSHEQITTSYALGMLGPDINYYWKVVATDSHGAAIEGPLWSFTIVQHTLTVNIVGNGSVNKNPDQMTYAYGTEVELTATPYAGYRFVKWTGDVSTIDNVEASSATVTMNGNYSITANFDSGACGFATAADLGALGLVSVGLLGLRTMKRRRRGPECS